MSISLLTVSNWSLLLFLADRIVLLLKQVSEEVKRKGPDRNTAAQLCTPYPECHNAQRYRQTTFSYQLLIIFHSPVRSAKIETKYFYFGSYFRRPHTRYKTDRKRPKVKQLWDVFINVLGLFHTRYLVVSIFTCMSKNMQMLEQF